MHKKRIRLAEKPVVYVGNEMGDPFLSSFVTGVWRSHAVVARLQTQAPSRTSETRVTAHYYITITGSYILKSQQVTQSIPHFNSRRRVSSHILILYTP
jgi:hypothetical protein